MIPKGAFNKKVDISDFRIGGRVTNFASPQATKFGSVRYINKYYEIIVDWDTRSSGKYYPSELIPISPLEELALCD